MSLQNLVSINCKVLYITTFLIIMIFRLKIRKKNNMTSLSFQLKGLNILISTFTVLGTVLTRTERCNYQSTASPRQQSNQTQTTKSVRRATRSSRTNGSAKYQGLPIKCKNTDSDTNQILLENLSKKIYNEL